MASKTKTDPPTQPEPVPGSSVNAMQAGRADAAARLAQGGYTPVQAEGNLALHALELANEQGEAPEDTVKRASQYLEFLKENQNG